MAMRIRDATPGDWDSVSRISRRSGYEDYINNHWGPSYLEDGRVLIAEDGEALGFGRVDILPDGAAWLSGLRVDPDHWREGVGSRITSRLVEVSGEMGAYAARMIVENSNHRSRKLSEKLGFYNAMEFRFFGAGLDLSRYRETEYHEASYVSLRWRFVRAERIPSLPGKFYSNGKNTVFLNEEGNTYFVLVATEPLKQGGEGMTIWSKENFREDLCKLPELEHFPLAVLYEKPLGL